MVVCQITEYCRILANIFNKANGFSWYDVMCNKKLNLCEVVSRRLFSISQRKSLADKEEEYRIQHKLTMDKYKESYDCCDKQTKQRNYMYISHRDAADFAVKSYLCSEIPENEVVLEVNPGLGILTRALLEAGVPYLRVYEGRPVFLHHLRELSDKYPSRLEIIEDDFLCTPRQPEVREKKFDILLQGIAPRKWKDTPIKIFITLPAKYERAFMKNLICSIPNTENMYQVGRAEFFLFLSGKEYMHIVAKPKENYSKYLSSTVLHSLFCDIHFFGMVDRACFFTPQRLRKPKSSYYDENMYFIKLTPKANIFEGGMTSKKLTELIHFVQTCMRKRKRNVISTMESYIPHCGPYLIKKGITVANKFGDLSPQELLSLFKVISSFPEYEMAKMRLDIASREELCEYDTGISTVE